MNTNAKSIHIDTKDAVNLSPYIFGHNLEHTRSAMAGGLSAQMLRNRKFAGRPSKNEGCPAEWFAIGGKDILMESEESWREGEEQITAYVKNWKEGRIPYRWNERKVVVIQNLTGKAVYGIGQQEISVQSGKCYELKAITRCAGEGSLRIQLTSRYGNVVYAEKKVSLVPGDWQISEVALVPDHSDADAAVRFLTEGCTWTAFGAVSMLPEGHFLGLRRDVIEHLKEIGVSMLRWPGGCYAADYRWQDGLLPVDMRAPIESRNAMETQPHTLGYDDHEIGTDEFIALCREIGAEPYISMHPMWVTPEESAAWVEYCNGSADTEYGRLRAERGYAEPYHVKYWALGNELGYVEAEGPDTPEAYAEVVRKYADAMLAVTPDLQLFSSGPHPDRDWAEKSAKALADKAAYVSVHGYSNCLQNYSTPEAVRQTCKELFETPYEMLQMLKTSREYLGDDLHIAFDEWNFWCAWFRPGSVALGLYTAKMLHMIMQMSEPLDMPVCCYFQPVGEGAIEVTPEESSLTGTGQIFSLMKKHKGGKLCKLNGITDFEAAATIRDGIMTVTLLNTDLDEKQEFLIDLCGEIVGAKVLCSDSVLPHSHFREENLEILAEEGKIKAVLPPHSAAQICVKID